MGSYFELASEQVEIPGGKPFAVRGLSFADLSLIVSRHGDVLAELFNDAAENGGELQAASIAVLVGELVRRAPEVVSLAIVLGADLVPTQDHVELIAASTAAARLPLHVQIDAMQKIGTITFGTEDGLKKAKETIISLLKGAQGVLKARAA